MRAQRAEGGERRGAAWVPPCITSLRCFGTDDIVRREGGTAPGMMSLLTNRRTLGRYWHPRLTEHDV